MPDEVKTEVETIAEPEVEERVEVEDDKVHPLEPGGERFSAVYKDMKDSQREAAALREENARLKAERAKAPTPAAEKFYTHQELQKMADAGQITPAQASAQLAWQERQLAKREIRTELQQERRNETALGEVQQYMRALPKLRDVTSTEYVKVRTAAEEIAAEMDLDITDPRVQRRALRESFGTLDKVTATAKTREFARQNADTHAETGRGGGSEDTQKKDPLKGVPSHYLEHWKRRGYSREQMIEEAKWIRPSKRASA